MRLRIGIALCALLVILVTLGTAAASVRSGSDPAAPQAGTTPPANPVPAAPLIPAAAGLCTVCSGDTMSAIVLASGVSSQLVSEVSRLAGEGKLHPVQAYRTSAATAEVSRAASRPVIPYTPEDLDLLARLITVEAGNEPYEVQVAVGAVVLNRVQSGAFPDSLREVIFQPGQFPPATNGRINRRAATASAVKAAEEALAGADPTDGCLYFTSARSASGFFLRRPGRITLGHMLFTN